MLCTCIPGHSIAQFLFLWLDSEKKFGSAFFLVCDENPKVTEGPANLHKVSKEARKQVCQLTTDSKQVLHSKQKTHYVSIQTKLRNYQSKPEKSQSS